MLKLSFPRVLSALVIGWSFLFMPATSCHAAVNDTAVPRKIRAGAMAASARPAPLSLNGGRLGRVAVSLPRAGKPVDVVILFADAPARPSARDAVARLTALGAAVAVIDSRAYFDMLGREAARGTGTGKAGDCLWLSSDFEELNLQIQHKLAFSQFRLPILVSSGAGGVLVYALLAEAPSYSYAGGVSIDFVPSADPKLNFCGVGARAADSAWLPNVELDLPWQVEPPAAARDAISDWINDVEKAELLQPAAGLSGPQHVAALVKPMIKAAVTQDPNNLEDLPLIEMPVDHPNPYVAIVYSGDGGWRDLDRSLGQILQDHDVPVVGVDSLLYFWQPKRPEVVAHDLERIVDHYRRAWHIDNVVLIGFSFGADILPFAYNRMSPDEKSSVKQISLLALSRNTRFEISVSEFISDNATLQTRLVGPELKAIPSSLLQCFYGEEEAADSGCTTREAAKAEIIETSGGHHFGDDYDALAKRIMDGATARLK